MRICRNLQYAGKHLLYHGIVVDIGRHAISLEGPLESPWHVSGKSCIALAFPMSWRRDRKIGQCST